MMNDTYLPHLDGLRALALMGVLLFHFEVPHFDGGFAGVDIFLSLSGFLITRNITRRLASQTFSLRMFYVRRFHRLYPASVVTVALALILSILTFPPPLAKSAAASGFATMQFVANMFFHSQANYFDADATSKPLLHMWSLSLEEQFYLLWAPTLFLIHRFKHGVRLAAVELFLLLSASLTAGIILHPSLPSVVFYELPPRIFQFAAGALVALWETSGNAVNEACAKSSQQFEEETLQYKPLPTGDDTDGVESPLSSDYHWELSVDDFAAENFEWQQKLMHIGKEVLSFSSVGVICLSYVVLPSNASPLHMLPTTVSTCLIIMLPDTFLSRYTLSNGLLQFIGRISYSAYLVHWPLWVFALHATRALRMGAPNPVVMFVATAFGATILRNSVESPFRQGLHKTTLAIITEVTGCVALAGVATDGFAFRFGNVDLDLSNMHQARMLRELCRDESGAQSKVFPAPTFHVETCRVGDLNGVRSKYVFFGDSFTLHLAGALHEIGKRRQEWYGLHFQSSCKFLPHSARGSISSKKAFCKTRHDALWSELEALENGSIVAVANSWGSRKTAEKMFPSLVKDIEATGHRAAMVVEPPGMASGEQRYFDCADFAVMPISRLWQAVRKGTFEGAKECAPLGDGLAPYQGRPEQVIAYRKLAKQLSVGLIEIFDQLCSKSEAIWRCRVPNLDKIVYDIGYRRDRHHLTKRGSDALSTVYEHALFAKKGANP